jgi:hypothetical protein
VLFVDRLRSCSTLSFHQKLLELLEKMKGTNTKEKDEIKAQLTALTAKIGEAMKKAREDVAKKATPAATAPVASTTTTATWKKLSADSAKQRLDKELDLLSKPKSSEASTGAATDKGEGEDTVESIDLSAAIPPPAAPADPSRVEALQKTLASLQEEAKQLGIPASEIAAQGKFAPFKLNITDSNAFRSRRCLS